MRRLDFGSVALHVLDDGTLPFPAQRFFANAPPDQWRVALDTDDQGRIAVAHNHGLLQVGRELVVIDTGYGEDTHGGLTGHLLEDLARAGHRPEDVTLVVATHAHGDHIKGHTRLHAHGRRPTFVRAHYLLSRADWDWFGGPGHAPEFDDHLATLRRGGRLLLFDGETCLAPGVRLWPTPGHTPGHTSVVVEAGGACVIFLGDVCHHPLHFAHPDWVSDFDTHPQLTPRTRARVFEFALAHDALLVCPHAPWPGLGRLERHGTGVIWVPSDR